MTSPSTVIFRVLLAGIIGWTAWWHLDAAVAKPFTARVDSVFAQLDCAYPSAASSGRC